VDPVVDVIAAQFKWDILAHAVFEGEQGIFEAFGGANGPYAHPFTAPA
jgi:hypothetical protein